jgi:CRP-like cAMP-binding protein
MALSEINRSGEIVEEEKFKSIDQYHLEIWSRLYDTLTTEETNALYYAMKESTYDAGQHIFKQGERDSNLYFINQGQLEVNYSVGGEEILLQTVGSGYVVGEETFFSNTVCTTSMRTLSGVKLNFLEKDSLMKWKDQFPALESKLHNHCLRSMKVYDLLERKGLDRRSQKRVNISGKAVIQLLNDSGNPVGNPFRARLSDISVGGLSFYIKIPKKEVARSLLGRSLNMKFILPNGSSEDKIDQNGTVVAVHSQHFDDYSVHIKFDAMLSEKVVEEVERFSNPSQ